MIVRSVMTTLGWCDSVTVISVVNTKGGAGKTTTAMLLAAAVVKTARRAIVWDADPQGTATDWAFAADGAGTPLPWAVQSVNTAELGRLKLDANCDIAVIDTPPGQGGVITAAIDAADFVLIPTKASNADVWRTLPTAEASNHRPQGILITQGRVNTNNLRDTKELFANEQLSFFDEVIPLREAIAAAVGTNPDETFGYETVLRDIEAALAVDGES